MDDSKILIQMPGTGVMIDYANQRERTQSLQLARSRQQIAERTGYIPAWEELGEAEHEGAALEARNWLRAAYECGLITEPAVTEWGIRYPLGIPGERVRSIGRPGEKLARSLLAEYRDLYETTAKLVYRETGDWKDAPETEDGDA